MKKVLFRKQMRTIKVSLILHRMVIRMRLSNLLWSLKCLLKLRMVSLSVNLRRKLNRSYLKCSLIF